MHNVGGEIVPECEQTRERKGTALHIAGEKVCAPGKLYLTTSYSIEFMIAAEVLL